MTKRLKNVTLVDGAVVRDSLGYLRDRDTDIDTFRFHSNRICRWLFAEAIKDLPMKKEKITTPLKEIEVERMNGSVVVLPILRSGIAMLFGALRTLPKATVGFVGLERDEKTAIAREYYWKLPEISKDATVIITDPMLATGGSIWQVLDRLKNIECASMRVVTVVTAPEGIERVQKDFGEVKIITAAVDEGLNDKAFIVPGLGDYGDRYFGTE